MKIISTLISAILLMMSCGSSKTNMEHQEKSIMSLSGDYTITSLKNTVIPNTLTLSFNEKENRVSGFSGCNSFFGSHTVSQNEVTFSKLASTKKFCGRSANTTERQYLDALRGITKFEIKDAQLLLYKNDELFIKATQQITTASKPNKANVPQGKIVGEHYYTNSILYTTQSRGGFERITISGTKVFMTTDKSLKNVSEYECTEEDSKTLNKLMLAIPIEKLIALKAPTSKRLYDGAPTATLELRLGDMLATTPSFDHGHPPKAIEALVNKVLSIKASVLE